MTSRYQDRGQLVDDYMHHGGDKRMRTSYEGEYISNPVQSQISE